MNCSNYISNSTKFCDGFRDKECNNISLTIITPTYNRKNYLPKLYQSLRMQKCKDFQWLVIDDGSTDGTDELFKEILKDEKCDFLIDYYKKNNAGKHTALNVSHNYIKGRIVMVVDSDDYLTEAATEVVINKWYEYRNNNSIGGITFQKGNSYNNEPLDKLIKEDKIMSFVEAINRGLSGDHCETFKKEIFIKHKFPTYKNEKFIGEGAMWYIMTKHCKVLYCKEVIYICEYLSGGLTKSGRTMRICNPRGGMWHAAQFLDKGFSAKVRLKNALLYNTYSFFCNDNFNVDNKDKLLIVKCLKPISYFLYKYWSAKY